MNLSRATYLCLASAACLACGEERTSADSESISGSGGVGADPALVSPSIQSPVEPGAAPGTSGSGDEGPPVPAPSAGPTPSGGAPSVPAPTNGVTPVPGTGAAPAVGGGAPMATGGAGDAIGGGGAAVTPTGGSGAVPAGAGAGGTPPLTPVGAPWDVTLDTLPLSSDFISEGAAVADVDDDGTLDLIAGPLWYRGPDFELGGAIDDAMVYEPSEYSLFFLVFAGDISGDGLPDVMAIGDAGGGNGTGNPNAHWYENPGADALDQPWTRRVLYDGLVSNESPLYVQLIGDDQPELLFMTDGTLGYATPGASLDVPWEYTAVSDDVFNTPYVHGLGVGDIDGNGLLDVVEAAGYWLQMEGGSFERHEVDFTEGAASGSRGGAQIQVFDVDGDGDADVITALSAHGYGLSWFEQVTPGVFEPHVILPASAGGDSFSQLHAMEAADLNGDGLLDLVTGKRYYAHPPPTDPGGTDAAVIYWFELTRGPEGAAFVPHLIHDDSGVGCNFAITDLDGNGRPDIFTSSKKGSFVHRQ